MRYKLLGRTGLRVSELCLGAMIFGDVRGSWGTSKEEAARILGAFAEAGGNFVDTANYYAGGESERILGELVASNRERWVIATKYGLNTRPGDPNGVGAHRKSLVRSLEESLRRLRTDYVDLYWVHIWDAFTPIQEVIRALDDVVRSGKALYVGISDTPAWIVSRAVTLADERGLEPFSALQVPYSLVERTVERTSYRWRGRWTSRLPPGRRLEGGCSPAATGPTGTGLRTHASPESADGTRETRSRDTTLLLPMR